MANRRLLIWESILFATMKGGDAVSLYAKIGLGAFIALSAACGGSRAIESAQIAPPVEAEQRPIEGFEVVLVSAPRPLVRDSGASLFYEMILRNRTDVPLNLSNVRVQGPQGPVATWSAGELVHNVALLRRDDSRVSGLRREPIAVPSDSEPGAIVIPPGLDAAVYVHIEREAGVELPSSLTHQILTNTPDGREQSFELPAVEVSSGAPPVISAPVAGGGWFIGNAPTNDSPHRRALYLIDDEYRLAQRFAVDLVRLSREGETFEGDPTNNESYHAYGAEILAVGDGVVRAINDDVPENVPGGCARRMDPSSPCDSSTAVAMTDETLAGNTIVLQIAPEVFVVYAHLRPGSIRVAVDEQVSSGQVLAELGNSGNSTEPHLHLHLCDRPSVLACQGIPFGLEAFVEQPVDPQTGPTGPPAMREHVMPIDMALLHFPPFPEQEQEQGP